MYMQSINIILCNRLVKCSIREKMNSEIDIWWSDREHNLMTSTFNQVLGIKPCEVFRNMSTEDFFEKYMTTMKATMQVKATYVKNLTVLVRANTH